MGPANPSPNATIQQWLTTVNFPACPARPNQAPPPAPIDPLTLAVRFWRTIPLPVPHPRIPPGYAITGKTAFLVTDGTTAPPPFTENTPLGALSVRASGTYLIDWGDGSTPTWTGPYKQEGQPWPNGAISHVYENVGTYTVTVQEHWTATWSLAGASGTLAGLATTAAIPAFRVEQLQAVINS